MTDPFGTPTDGDTSFSFDLTEDKADDKYYVPPGDYLATCVDIEETLSKAGNPMLVWTFAIFAGDHAGKELRTWTVLKASAIWKLREVAEALGLVDADSTKLKFEKNDALMRCAMLRIEDNEYGGKTRSSIESVSAHPKGAGYKAGNP